MNSDDVNDVALKMKFATWLRPNRLLVREAMQELNRLHHDNRRLREENENLTKRVTYLEELIHGVE